MNTLSILLYLSDLFSSLNSILLTLIIILIIVSIVLFISISGRRDDKDDSYLFRKSSYGKCIKILLFIIPLIVITPSKDTIYLIAASEVGENMVESPVAQRLATKIEKYLDNTLNISTEE